MTALTLPMPPSVNALYFNRKSGTGRGRIKTPAYRKWAEAAGWQIIAQRPERHVGPVSVSVEVEDAGPLADADNLLKALMDLLVSYKIIEADHRKIVRKVSIEWAAVSGCVVSIEPRPFNL